MIVAFGLITDNGSLGTDSMVSSLTNAMDLHKLQGSSDGGVPPFLESPLFLRFARGQALSDIAEAVGVPSRLSGKGQEAPT